MKDKLGPYIQRLMTTVIDTKHEEKDEFVRNLAWNELRILRNEIDSFLSEHEIDDEEKSKNTVEKMLLLDREEKDA